jgi:hypothetical protein
VTRVQHLHGRQRACAGEDCQAQAAVALVQDATSSLVHEQRTDPAECAQIMDGERRVG